jgi:opacity protein-like surface antigen
MNTHHLTIGTLGAILLLAATQLHASSGFHQGFYLGGALGAGFGHADWDGVSSLTAINDQGATLLVSGAWTPEGESSATELAGRVMLGYQFVHQSLYLAAEMGGTFAGKYQFDSKDSQQYHRNYTGSVPPYYDVTMDASASVSDSVTLGSSEFNLDLRPGWLFNDNFLIYARVGLAINELSIENSGTWSNLSSSYPYYPIPYTLTVDDSSKQSETAWGIRLGLGGEYLVTENLGISLDYIYTNYGSISTSAEASGSTHPIFIIDPTISPYYSVHGIDAPDVSVSTQTVMLGLLWHW